MFIEPNSTVELYRGINLDNKYDNVYFFDSGEARESFFNSTPKKVYTFFQQYYQRVERGKLKLKIKYAEVFDVNYMRFKNTSFENMWFYCFVHSCQYINNETTQITYSLDVMTTWFDKYEPRMCFVEREHSSTDEVGDNLIPENLPCGDYIDDDKINSGCMNSFHVVIAATVNKTIQEEWGWQYTQGTFSGLTLSAFPATQTGIYGASSMLRSASTMGKAEQIIDLFYYPSVFVKEGSEYTPPIIVTREIQKPISGGFGTYQNVRNKKLYTYPYQYLHVTNCNGVEQDYKYERFVQPTAKFNFSCEYTPNSQLVMTTEGYSQSSSQPNYEGSITVSDFPRIAWNTDTYAQWLAYTSKVTVPSILANTLTGGVSGAMNIQEASTTRFLNAATLASKMGYVGTMGGAAAFGAGAIGAGTALASGIADIMMQHRQASMNTLSNNGYQASTTSLIKGLYDVYFTRRRITSEYAKIIDDYFTMFGYATLAVKTPNRNVRERWCYVKTQNFELENYGIPEDDVEVIKSVFNRGTTFWKTSATIGDYSPSNNPV